MSTEAFAYWFNIIEMAIWAVIAVIILAARFRRQKWLSFNLPLGFTFLLFSLSDYIEANIGSYWESGWLFAIKASCVLSMAYHAVKYYKGLKSDGT
ncbi:MAG: hypothetical protein ABSA77_10740 [Thermoguttaceae bacterium]|jgi:hypothetical protein